MTSLPITMKDNGKARTSWEPNKIYIVRKVLKRAIQKCNFYWIRATVSKVMGIYVKCTKTTHQIWSCHVTPASNSENFYFLPNSILNFRKSYQIWEKLAQEQKRYRQKKIGGGKDPVLIGLNFILSKICFALLRRCVQSRLVFIQLGLFQWEWLSA